MSDDETLVRSRQAQDGNGVAPDGVARFYVDAAEVHVQPFTVQVALGSTGLNGEANPSVLLIMSPNFAFHLRECLNQAMSAFTTQAEAVGDDGGGGDGQ